MLFSFYFSGIIGFQSSEGSKTAVFLLLRWAHAPRPALMGRWSQTLPARYGIFAMKWTRISFPIPVLRLRDSSSRTNAEAGAECKAQELRRLTFLVLLC